MSLFFLLRGIQGCYKNACEITRTIYKALWNPRGKLLFREIILHSVFIELWNEIWQGCSLSYQQTQRWSCLFFIYFVRQSGSKVGEKKQKNVKCTWRCKKKRYHLWACWYCNEQPSQVSCNNSQKPGCKNLKKILRLSLEPARTMNGLASIQRPDVLVHLETAIPLECLGSERLIVARTGAVVAMLT